MSEPRHDQSGTEELREMLREWRMEQALKRSPEEGQRAFRVFHDTTLDEICIRKPRSETALSEIFRFGKKTDTYQKYATGVVKVVNDWAESRSADGLRLDDYSYEDGGGSFGGMLGESPWAKILWELYDSFSGGDPGIARRQIRERTGCDARAVRSVLQRMEGLGFFNAERGDGGYLLEPNETRVKRLIMSLAQLEGGHRENAVKSRIEHLVVTAPGPVWMQWSCDDPLCVNDHCPECWLCDHRHKDGHGCLTIQEEFYTSAQSGLATSKLDKMLEGDEGGKAELKAARERVEVELARVKEEKARVLTKDAMALTLDAYLNVSPPGESPTPVSRADLFEVAQSRGFSGSSARFSQILTSMEEDGQISREQKRDDETGRIVGMRLKMEAKLWTARRREMEQDRSRPGTQRWREEVAENNPRAYEPWEVEEDELLRSRVAEGWSVEDLAEAHRRRPGAVRSRIRKLDLEG